MKSRIEHLPTKTLVGKRIRMSLSTNKTFELWNSFMTTKESIKNKIGTDLFSIQVYDSIHYFDTFNPKTQFTKWAAIEVENNHNTPDGFCSFNLESGLYVVFIHKGTPAEFPKTFQYILYLGDTLFLHLILCLVIQYNRQDIFFPNQHLH